MQIKQWIRISLTLIHLALSLRWKHQVGECAETWAQQPACSSLIHPQQDLLRDRQPWAAPENWAIELFCMLLIEKDILYTWSL
jgi:hypothetical protein